MILLIHINTWEISSDSSHTKDTFKIGFLNSNRFSFWGNQCERPLIRRWFFVMFRRLCLQWTGDEWLKTERRTSYRKRKFSPAWVKAPVAAVAGIPRCVWDKVSGVVTARGLHNRNLLIKNICWHPFHLLDLKFQILYLKWNLFMGNAGNAFAKYNKMEV